MTGCGKSTMARSMFLSAAAPRLVIDPADSSLTITPGCVTFSDPLRATNAHGENWRQAATARFVPADPDDLELYDAVYRFAFAHFPRHVWCDEAATILPVRSTPAAGRKYLYQGRKRQLGHLACTTRPREICTYLKSDSEHVLAWGELGNPEDLPIVAGLLGLERAEAQHELAQLPRYGFLWRDKRARTITACPPLRL